MTKIFRDPNGKRIELEKETKVLKLKTVYNYNDISYSFGPDYDCNEYYLNEIGFDYEEI